jgi:hypothetical protein
MRRMKLLIIAGLLLCAYSSTAAGQAADDLTLRVELTTGERSRDSSSKSTTLTIAPGSNIIGWRQTISGRRHGMAPEPKEFKLSPADRAALLKLIRARHLLVTNSIALPEGSGFLFFAISVALSLHGKTGAISISGPRTAKQVTDEKLYQNTLALIKEIYRIINTQDDTVSFEELVFR